MARVLRFLQAILARLDMLASRTRIMPSAAMHQNGLKGPFGYVRLSGGVFDGKRAMVSAYGLGFRVRV